ncbi:hypothetical protein NQZ68_024658 [Dissostichus eleginoides]|nr:hypothetical protein NQZ68_024658 [Dissostichus eleginoides]
MKGYHFLQSAESGPQHHPPPVPSCPSFYPPPCFSHESPPWPGGRGTPAVEAAVSGLRLRCPGLPQLRLYKHGPVLSSRLSLKIPVSTAAGPSLRGCFLWSDAALRDFLSAVRWPSQADMQTHLEGRG